MTRLLVAYCVVRVRLAVLRAIVGRRRIERFVRMMGER